MANGEGKRWMLPGRSGARALSQLSSSGCGCSNSRTWVKGKWPLFPLHSPSHWPFTLILVTVTKSPTCKMTNATCKCRDMTQTAHLFHAHREKYWWIDWPIYTGAKSQRGRPVWLMYRGQVWFQSDAFWSVSAALRSVWWCISTAILQSTLWQAAQIYWPAAEVSKH